MSDTAEDLAREFTYYPIMSPEDCWFRVETFKGAGTYHQCHKHGKRGIGYTKFCERHFKIVETAIQTTFKNSCLQK